MFLSLKGAILFSGPLQINRDLEEQREGVFQLWFCFANPGFWKAELYPTAMKKRNPSLETLILAGIRSMHK